MAKRGPAIRSVRCECCGTDYSPRDRCPSCEIYNVAVTAQKAAAQEIARNFDSSARDAWLNEHGVFAWIGGVTVQVGSPYEAAPFVKLTGAARGVVTFQPRRPTPRRSNASLGAESITATTAVIPAHEPETCDECGATDHLDRCSKAWR